MFSSQQPTILATNFPFVDVIGGTVCSDGTALSDCPGVASQGDSIGWF